MVEIEPDNAEARTYIGWLIALNGQQTQNQEQVQQGIEFLQQAAAMDDTYADPHCFLAVANLRFLDPPQTDVGEAEAQACLDRNPPADMRPMIEALTTG